MPEAKTNSIGLEKKDYLGGKSTLCVGCGHDSVTNQLINALYQSGVDPYSVAKMSGIGCSSKTPAYFLNLSHGFNSLHGRMAPLSTGAKVANHNLNVIGISGDGDTASIGFGGFAHLIRRNLPMVYIVENNGVYGLTKGQFSATADKESVAKSGDVNPFETIDLCTLALDLGATFVARSFSGDNKQMVPLLRAAFQHRGTALIDVISPCVTFANHEGSTKSFHYVKEHQVHLQELGFIAPREEISVDYQEGDTQEVQMHDGSRIVLKKLDSKSYDVKDRLSAIQTLYASRDNGEILTGLFYCDEESDSFIQQQKLSDKPLTELDESAARLTQAQMNEVLSEFR
jgi:2-oxoglutarate ferredoxin oxidoreductase subunit beta